MRGRRTPFKDGLATTGEASVVLGVSAKIVSVMCRNGKLPTLPRTWCVQYRIRIDDLARFAATYRPKPHRMRGPASTHQTCLQRKHGHVCPDCQRRIMDAWHALWREAG